MLVRFVQNAAVPATFSAALCGAVLSGATGADAQSGSPAQPSGAMHFPADPTRLPGDHPPPPLSVMIRPPGAADDIPPAPIGNPPPGPGLADAEALAHATLAACATTGHAMGIVVIDSAGTIRVALSMPGTGPGGRVFTATQKALAALTFGMPTRDAQAQLRNDPAMRARVTPNIAVFPGGRPIFDGTRLIGAVAASGGTAADDDACVAAGIRAWHAAG